MDVIPCPHESGAVTDYNQEASDYHPLTREEIAALLNEAKTSQHPLTSRIQVRLCQGIPGLVCPRVVDGPIAEKEGEIDHLYVANFRRGADPELVEKLYSIMTR